MDIDSRSSPTIVRYRISFLPINGTKKFPDSHRTFSARSFPYRSQARSYLNLLIDQYFPKSFRRRQRYTQVTNSFKDLFVCWILLFLVPLSLFTSTAKAAGMREAIAVSRDLKNTSSESGELMNLSKPLVRITGSSTSDDELDEVELSEDLNLAVHTGDGLQSEDFSIFDQNDLDTSLDLQPETMLAEDYSRIYGREEQIDDLVTAERAQIYTNRMHVDFRALLYASSEDALYAVAKEATLVKLNGKTLTVTDAYTVPSLAKASSSCQKLRGCNQYKEINVLSKTPGKPFIFYCSLHLEEYPRGISRQTVTNCAVPNPTKLSENLLIWDSDYYTSMDSHRPPVILIPDKNAAEQSAVATPHQPFFYVAGVTSNFLHIGRLQMPDWASGDIRWDGALFSPKRSVFINEPATVVMSFDTETAVYFLLREKPSSFIKQRPPLQVVSRLVRVCRGDQGGLRGIAEHYFGTMAKADLFCQSDRAAASANKERSHFYFSSVQSAYWDAEVKRLYAVFSAGEGAPLGSAVCVFDLTTIERVFRGPISNFNYPQRQPACSLEGNIWTNPFPNICERYAAGNLTDDELSLGQLGANFLYRYEPVTPLFSHAVTMSSSTAWTAILGYQLPSMTSARFRTTILWLASATHLTQFAVYEGYKKVDDITNSVLLSTCELRRIRVGQDDNILERLQGGLRHGFDSQKPPFQQEETSRLHPSVFYEEYSWQNTAENLPELTEIDSINSMIRKGDFIFVGTTRSILRLPTDMCTSYLTENACLSSGNPHCGWNSLFFSCVGLMSLSESQAAALSLAVDLKTLPRCPSPDPLPVKSPDADWSAWRPCHMTSDPHSKMKRSLSEMQPSCLCRICLSEACNFGEQQVSQCKVPGVWSPWSRWSQCQDKLRLRTRTCLNPFLGTSASSSDCLGDDREEQFCLLHPLVTEEVSFQGMRAEHVALSVPSSSGVAIDKNHLMGLLVGLFLGSLCTLFLVFLLARFCRFRLWLVTRKNNQLRPRFHSEQRTISNIQLESQLRNSLLEDHPIYANPSSIDRSIHSTSFPRYDFVLRPRPPLSTERIYESTLASIEEASVTTDLYDRLSENNK